MVFDHRPNSGPIQAAVPRHPYAPCQSEVMACPQRDARKIILDVFPAVLPRPSYVTMMDADYFPVFGLNALFTSKQWPSSWGIAVTLHGSKKGGKLSKQTLKVILRRKACRLPGDQRSGGLSRRIRRRTSSPSYDLSAIL